LAIAAIDNEHYGETGMQASHTGMGVELAEIARAAGFKQAAAVRTMSEIEKAVPILYGAKGPVLIVLKVLAERDPLVLPSWDGPHLKSRFRHALLGAKA
jgi:thiamine pyrophosphate-dependent acetolactate synthase large subunit-like protein